MQQHPLALVQVAECYARTWVVAGREVAPLGARRGVCIWVPDDAQLIGSQAVEEGPRGDGHLSAPPRGRRNLSTHPRPGLGRRHTWRRIQDSEGVEAEDGRPRGAAEEAPPTDRALEWS